MSSTSVTERVEHYVGIDVSKAWLDAHLRPQNQRLHCGNDQPGFARIDRWLRSHGADPAATLICMENTGVYDDRLLAALTEAGWSCAVEKTTVLEKVTPEHHRKDDAFDAAGLAEYADRFADRLTLWSPPPESPAAGAPAGGRQVQARAVCSTGDHLGGAGAKLEGPVGVYSRADRPNRGPHASDHYRAFGPAVLLAIVNGDSGHR